MCLSPPSSSCMVSKTTSLFRCTTPVTRAVVILLFGLHVANVLASVPLEVGAVPLRADGRRHFRDWGKLTDKELDDIAMQWDDNEDADSYHEDDPEARNSAGVPNMLLQANQPVMIFVTLKPTVAESDIPELAKKWSLQMSVAAIETKIYPIGKSKLICTASGAVSVARAEDFILQQPEVVLITVNNIDRKPGQLPIPLPTPPPSAGGSLRSLPPSARVSYPGGPAAFDAALKKEDEDIAKMEAEARIMNDPRLGPAEIARRRRAERAQQRREEWKRLQAERRRRKEEARARRGAKPAPKPPASASASAAEPIEAVAPKPLELPPGKPGSPSGSGSGSVPAAVAKTEL